MNQQTNIQDIRAFKRDFKCVFETRPIIIPDMRVVTEDCKRLWGESLSAVAVPEKLKTGTQKKIKIIRTENRKSFQEVICALSGYRGAVLSNVFGLRVAEITCHLPKYKWIRGIDKRANLSFGSRCGNRVPDIKINLDETVSRGWLPAEGLWPHGSHFLIFCD